MGVRIITNNVPRFTVYAHELTAAEREQYDYHDWAAIDDGRDSATFFRYRGELYDLGNFIRIESDDEFKDWNGYSGDSYFSGTLVKLIDDESIIVGRYYQ